MKNSLSQSIFQYALLMLIILAIGCGGKTESVENMTTSEATTEPSSATSSATAKNAAKEIAKNTGGEVVAQPTTVQQAVESHFGTMNFTTTKVKDANTANAKSYKGALTVKDKTGKEVETRWLLTLNDDGKPSGVYVGAATQKVSNVFAMTEDELWDRLKECNGKEGESLKACYDKLMGDLITDCVLENKNCEFVIW